MTLTTAYWRGVRYGLRAYWRVEQAAPWEWMAAGALLSAGIYRWRCRR